MDIMTIVRAVVDVIISIALITLALDMIKWTLTDDMGKRSDDFIGATIDRIVDLPVKILMSVVKLAFKVVEAAVKAIVSLFSQKAADSIDFGIAI